MRIAGYAGAAIGLAFMAAGARAQEAVPQNAEPEAPAVLCVVAPPNQQAAKQNEGQNQPEKPSVVKDVGSAVGGTAGQIAGAAVAGPIGAAAGGVVVEKVGRAVAKVVKGGKKKKDKQAEQTAASASAACVAEAPAQPGQ